MQQKVEQDVEYKIENRKQRYEKITDIKFWRNRIKYDTSFKYSTLVFYIILTIIFNYIFGFEFFTSTLFLVAQNTILMITFFALYIGKSVPINFQDQLEKTKEILKPEIQEKYEKFVLKKFSSKKEFYIPIILVIPISAIGWFYNFTFGSNILMNGGFLSIIFIGAIILSNIYLLFGIFLVASAFILIINSFSCINKLGSDEFPLSVTYEDLKTGTFEELGKFIISTNIPVIAVATFVSILGLYEIFIIQDLIIGYFCIVIGLFASSFLAFLLYRDTIQIHTSIIRHKKELQKKAIRKIQHLLGDDDDDDSVDIETTEIDFSEIESIHHFYNEVLTINDWPFNPGSIKKLVITLGSTLIPFILSLFGIF